MGQREHVLHRLQAGQGFGFDGLEAQLGRAAADGGDQRSEMAARPHQHGDAVAGALGAGLADDGEHLLRFGLGVVGE